MWYKPLHATKDKAVSLFWVVWICFMTFTGAIRTSRSTMLLRPGWVIQGSKQLKCRSTWLGASPGRLDAATQIYFLIPLLLFCGRAHGTLVLVFGASLLSVCFKKNGVFVVRVFPRVPPSAERKRPREKAE